MIETRDSLIIDTKQFEVESLRAELSSMTQQRDDWESAYYEAHRHARDTQALLLEMEEKYYNLTRHLVIEPLDIVDED